MIDAIIAGKLHSKPVAHTGKSGKPFVTAKVRVDKSNSERQKRFRDNKKPRENSNALRNGCRRRYRERVNPTCPQPSG